MVYKVYRGIPWHTVTVMVGDALMKRQVEQQPHNKPLYLVPKFTRPIPNPARPTPVPSRPVSQPSLGLGVGVLCSLSPLALGDSSPCIEAFRHTPTSCYWTRTGPGGNLDAAACLRDNLRNVHIKRMQEEPLANRYRKLACTESGAGA